MRKRRYKGNGPKQEGAPAWMTTYGDLVTLLLTFFVLLLAFSEIDAQKFKAMIMSFQGSTGNLDSSTILTTEEILDYTIETLQDSSIVELKSTLEGSLKDLSLYDKVTISLESEGLLLRLQDNIIFDSGKAEVKAEAKEIIMVLSELLKSDNLRYNRIQVEGHTDTDQIMQPNIYRTNWDLSVARASNVVQLFIEGADMSPRRFSASGYSEYYPIADNESAESKAQNRRVDILILKDTYTP